MKGLFLFLIKFPPYEQVIVNVYPDLAKRHDFYYIMPASDRRSKGYLKWNNVHCYITRPYRKKFILKLFDYLLSWFEKSQYAIRLVKDKDIDFVLVRNDPLDALLGLYLKKRWGVKLIFRYTYPIYEDLIISSKDNLSPYPKFLSYLFGNIGNFIIFRIMGASDMVLAMSDYMEQDIRKKGTRTRIEVLTMGAKKYKVYPKYSEIVKKFSIFYPTLIYLGNMDKIRDIGFIIDVFHELKKEGIRFKALMIGGGNDMDNLKAKAAGLDVIFTGKVDPDEVPKYIAASDIGLSPFKPIDILKTTTPTKLMEYMALGKPYVCNKEIPDMDYVTRESKGGLAVSYDVQEFKEAIKLLILNKKLSKEMGLRGKRWILKNREYTKLAKELEKCLIDVIS
jgi:glycosyltransferase involved in cell wall biosynthesis